MKKSIVLAITLFVAGATFAQVSLGLSGGPQFSSFNFIQNGEKDENVDFALGFNVGMPLEISVGKFFAIQPELNFSRRGAQSTTDVFGITTDVKQILNYMELPVLVKVGYKTDRFKAYLTGGPNLGFAVSGKVISKFALGGVATTEEDPIEFDDSDGVNRFDFGGNVGLNLQVRLIKNLHLNLDGRYLMGITDIENKNADITLKNKGVSICAGFFFEL